MISYSAKAARALGYLKRRYNDIDVYVEDTSGYMMWLRLLKNVFPGSVRIRSVNLLGGRKQVVDVCRLDQDDDGRRKLYIVDADFDLLCNRRRINLKYLYRLKAYCIENILLHEDCICEVGLELSIVWESARHIERHWLRRIN